MRKRNLILETICVLVVMAGIYSVGLSTQRLSLGLFSAVVGWLLSSFFLKKQGESWREFGFKRPRSWPQTVMISLAGGVLLHLLISQVLKPMITQWTLQPLDISSFEVLRGNVSALLGGLVVVWTVAAFGEELIFRGYFLNRFAEIVPNHRMGWVIAALLSSLLFGLGHIYQGLSGMILSAIVGLLYIGAYFITGRNLWAPILIHGIYDTTAFFAIFLSLDKKIPRWLSILGGN
jgi:membrane protease YdiL (CAAX protease family)